MSSMADLETPFPIPERHDAELRASAELERLPGVVSAAVWLDPRGALRLARIHMLPGVAPTIVSNAAGRVLQSLGISGEPRAIRLSHVALPEELQGYQPAQAHGWNRFLLLQDIGLHRTGAHVTCRVQLVRDDNVASGEASELDTGAGRIRAAAHATLRAAENATDNIALGLEGAVVTSLFGRNYAAVSVEATLGRRVANLAAMVAVEPGRAVEESVCLAVLRAIDRWIGG
jgi:hypothetical protein